MNTNELLSQLRKFVLIKSGLRNIDPAHCKTISELVFKETKNYVSETTVKRFFGFAQTLHKFSLFTLNSLSQYVGYTDWESFCKDKKSQTEDINDVWSDLKIRCQAVTDVSLIAKKNNSGVPFEATANRSFLYSDFDYFLKNDYQFTTISAQPGQGKSILLAHLVEHFFYSENAVYKKDIVLLINSGTINDIIQNNLSLKDWFLKEFKFAGVSELITYFKKNPKECKGRFVLIIDGIDLFLSKSKYFKIFTDFLFSLRECDFVKIVLGLRVNNWVNMQPAISGSAFLTKSWYKGLFFDDDKDTNVPLLNKEEILYTLTRIEGKPIKGDDIHPDLIKQFRTPFWLQIYYKLKQENNTIRLNNYLLCLELINYFLENRVFLSKNSTEKIFILKEISNTVSKGNLLTHRVPKERILNSITSYAEAYQELIYSGVIIEEKRLTTSIPTEIIRFLNDDIYTYFLFLQLTEKFNFKPDKAFFEEILNIYSGQQELRKLMLNWSIRFCINRNEIQALKQIFKLPFSNEEKNSAFDFICNVALFELEKPDSNFNGQTIDIHFIDIMVMGRIISKNYKEAIKKISEKVFNEDIQIMLHVIECGICVIDMDKNALNENMNTLKRHSKKLQELFPINPYDLILYLSNTINNKPNNIKTLDEKIVKLCEKVDKSDPHKNDDITSAEIIVYRFVIIVLFTNKNYEECANFLSAILKKYPNLFYLRSSIFSSLLIIFTAQTCIKLEKFKQAQRLIQYLDTLLNASSTYFTPYIKCAYILAKANFLNHTKNYDKALGEINKGLAMAGENEIQIIEIAFRLLKIDVLKRSKDTENINQNIKDLLKFVQVNKLSLPDFANVNSIDFDHTFNILKSYKSGM
ncbi:hypothetical protein [Pedobacter aquatilis]|uniref:hypothetical protein n=1 Tax=Pedobacter aquatilis TaxID=351343 RepID=UPI00292EF3B6|nr:hypothetical protein [Pedobacter aquatilis]